MSTPRAKLLPLAVAGALAAAALVVGTGDRAELATDDADDRPVADALPRSAASPTLAGALLESAGEARDEAGCTLRGVVLGPQGPQVANLVLRRIRSGPARPARALHRLDRRERALALTEESLRVEAALTTASDGAFEFRGLALGAYVLEAEAPPGLAGAGRAAFDLPRAVCHLTLRLDPATERVAGRARWANGAPYVGVVRASEDGRPFEARAGSQGGLARITTTAADGSFAFAGLRRGNLALVAVVEGAWRSWPLWIALPRAEPVEFVVDGGGQTLGGRVLDASNDAPIEGAQVRIEGYGQHGAAGAAAVSGPDGAFTVPWGYDASAWILVEAPGYARRAWSQVACGTPFGFRLHRAARLEGRITDPSGAPVPGLPLELLGCDVADGARTDVAGRYAFTDLPEGEVWVTTFGEGWVPRGMRSQNPWRDEAWFDPTAALLVAGETTTLDVVVERGARVRGRVVQADGSAAAGVGVYLRKASDDERCGGVEQAPALWVSDERGAFEVGGLLPGVNYVLAAWGPGDAGVEQSVRAPSPPEVGEIVLALPAASTWRVAVRDAVSGAPIAGARVSDATTDRDGLATLGPRHAQTTYAYVWAEHYLPWQGRLERDGPDGVASVTLRPARTLRGRVVFPDGRDVQSVVETKTSGDPFEWSAPRGWTDGAGRFEHTVPAGVDLVVTAERRTEGFEWSASASVSPGMTDVVLTLVAGEALAPERAPPERFRLRVVDPAGQPVASLELDGASWARDQEPREPGVHWLDQRPRPGSEITVHDARDAEGRSLGLAAHFTGPLPDLGDELTIRLEPESPLLGRVVDAQGTPIAGVGVNAVPARRALDRAFTPRGAGLVLARGRSDGTGRFRLRGLAAEPYVLTLGPPAGFFAPRRVVAEGGGDEIEIVLRSAVAARVRVRDPRGAPLAGLRVVADLERYEHSWRWGDRVTHDTRAEGVTDASGTALLSGLDPGEPHRLRVVPPHEDVPEDLGGWQALLRGAGDLILDRWRPADVTLVFTPSAPITGSVRDAQGRAVGDATIYWSAGGGAWHAERVWGDDGTFWLDVPADAGRIALAATASAQEAPGPGAPVVFAAPGARDVRLTLDLGLPLEVSVDRTPITVQWIDGAVPSNAAVLVPEGGHPDRPALQTEGHASFTFRGLERDASYTLWIFGGRDERMACVRGVRAAHSPLSVTLEEGREITGQVVRPPGVVRLEVTATCGVPGMLASATVDPDGRFTLRGLLDVPWTVVATGEDERADYEAAAVADPGATLRLDLRAAPAGPRR